MQNLIHAPIPSVKSSSSPERLCAPIGNSCPGVKASRFMIRNSNDTGWVKRPVSTFRSKDPNFGRINNDKPRRSATSAAHRQLNELKEAARKRRDYYLFKKKEYASV